MFRKGLDGGQRESFWLTQHPLPCPHKFATTTCIGILTNTPLRDNFGISACLTNPANNMSLQVGIAYILALASLSN